MVSPAGGPPPLPTDPERRSRLRGVQLRALVRDHLGRDPDASPQPFPPGAALLADGEAWVLLADDPDRRLGGALAWAVRQGARRLHVVAESGTGVIARRAAQFRFPIEVWHAEGRDLLPAVALPVEPPAPVRPEHLALREVIVAGGATPVVEHGVLFGEVRGLEVCRVVDDPHLGVVRLEVGVGAHDREAFQMIHGDVPTVDALARVVDAVARQREPGATQHPLNRLAAERFLRWRLEQDPSLVGAAHLEPAQPPVPRPNVKDAVPCVASGRSIDGGPLLVVCTTGVDLDVVPYAADARLAAAASGVGDGEEGVGSVRTVIASPTRDQVALLVDLAALLAQSVELVAVD
jgi:hypothetical protein